jgi:ubiquinone/menaquinone biosynthesis C-methylase UbiE
MTANAMPQDVPTVAEQASNLLTQAAGYAGYRTMAMGLRTGLVHALAEFPDSTPDDLADRLDLDPFYVSVWCRSALAAAVCDRNGDAYRLAPQMATLLLDRTSPAYTGGLFMVLGQREMFDRFEESLRTGERMWWDECSSEWIAGVAGTGAPFYTRLVPRGLKQVPGLVERLAAGCRIVDTACGAGAGVARLAEHYPRCQIMGADGDQHSIDLAAKRIASAGLANRVTLVCSHLEDLQLDTPATLVINNISMHECRDIDRVTDNIKAALEPGGWFVISDFPFPDTTEGLRSVPGRIMSAIQFFEAQIDDQLLPRSAYDDLLIRHGFSDLGSFSLTPMHAVTYGRK